MTIKLSSTILIYKINNFLYINLKQWIFDNIESRQICYNNVEKAGMSGYNISVEKKGSFFFYQLIITELMVTDIIYRYITAYL
jgi:hypothetical protein